MPEDGGGAVSSLEEFWEGLEARGVEPDLQATLRARAGGASRGIERVGDAAVVTAVAARLVQGDVPPEDLAAFLDAHFDEQLGRGDERIGVMPRAELIPAGFRALEAAARARHGTGFAESKEEDRDRLLADAEAGRLEGEEGFDAAEWFRRTRDLLLLAYGSDPRGMVEMGFPGPSYATGHVWLDTFEVARRAERAPGADRL
ncbi:MAG TPA: gluconate 2-dehydrogenase subunit 3 family protein [Actinomycetota bacterium]|nr:gluconate 2-dehydrogenase subunit 3 family protein [Actinomycetota bacterium]